MTKRPRSESDESVPDLEPLAERDSDDDLDMQFDARGRRRSEQEHTSSPFSSDSDDDEPTDVQHSLLEQDPSLRVEPFSMKAERREGLFDAEGNIDDGKGITADTRDAWLDSLDATESSRDDIEKSRENLRVRNEFWQSTENGPGGPEEIAEYYLFLLMQKLQPGETPRAAMDRYLGIVKPNRPTRSTIKAKRAPKEAEKSAIASKDTDSFNEVTELCDAIVAKGIHTILEEPRQRLHEILSLRKFEYRWKAQPEGQVFGPFPYEQLMEWKGQGCFTSNPIQMRYYESSQPWRELSH